MFQNINNSFMSSTSGPLVHCHSPGFDIPFRYFLFVISLLLVEDFLADSSAFTGKFIFNALHVFFFFLISKQENCQ